MRNVGWPEITPSKLPSTGKLTATAAASGVQTTASETSEAEASVTTTRVSAGASAPVDTDRVAEIRKALEQDRYPLVPAKIADGLIAAGLYGIVGK